MYVLCRYGWMDGWKEMAETSGVGLCYDDDDYDEGVMGMRGEYMVLMVFCIHLFVVLRDL